MFYKGDEWSDPVSINVGAKLCIATGIGAGALGSPLLGTLAHAFAIGGVLCRLDVFPRGWVKMSP